MQLDFLFRRVRPIEAVRPLLDIGTRQVPIQFVRNHRAKRYIIRVQPDGSIRTTVPRGGTLKEASAFAARNREWIAGQLQRRQDHAARPQPWQHGSEILYRGQKVLLQVAPNHDGYLVSFGEQSVRVTVMDNLRPAVERHLWRLARRELTPQVVELARQHNISLRRVTVRNQRSRWGSSSRKGTISLNWRLIQTPDFVQRYIITHELMHQREMNHSKRFWQHVAEACPYHKQAEAWLKQHRGLLR
jgi:predicted metal-dependent hydrolase